MRRTLFFGVFVAVKLLCPSAIVFANGNGNGNELSEAQRRPNILFVFTDDQPISCVGCMGNEHIQTPHIDRLARDGVMFENAFVTTAICCSNRATILTGQHLKRHGIEDFETPLSASAMAATYPVLLRSNGYQTAYLGKFAVGRPDEKRKHLSLPLDQFDFWYGFPQSINFLQEEDDGPHYLTTRMEEEAVKFLSRQSADAPFCLTVALKEPHGPMNYFDPDVADVYAEADLPAPTTFTHEHFARLPEFLQTSLGGLKATDRLENPESLQALTRRFYRLITRADLAVGRIRAALAEYGFDDNTVVIFSSDHGSMLGAHGLNGKWLMFEESIRVPLIVFDPRYREAGNRRQLEMALSIDLAPTMLDLAGVPIPDAMQGRSLVPLIENKEVPWREDWYYEHTYANPPVHPIPRTEGVRTETWKYVRYTDFDPPHEQLFNLAEDPLEENDRSADAEVRDVLERLRQRCNQLAAMAK